MKNSLRFVFMSFLWVTGILAYAQGPVCTSLNVPVGPNDTATIVVGDFVPNASTAATPLTVTIQNPYGGVITQVTMADATTEIEIAACPYIGRELMFLAENSDGSCMSAITFKQSNGPIIEERADTVYCGDPLTVGGHIGGVAPAAVLPCAPDGVAEFVADWTETFDCVLGENIAKIIYREYEAYDKFGNRGTGVDTIYVYRLPEISLENTFCGEKDTTYCGVSAGDEFGPFMLVPILGTTECDTLYFLNPDGSAATFDPKCGISVAVNVDPFGGECAPATKYTVHIKQSCYGTAEGTCASQDVPENGLEMVAEGYWVCEFWQVDLDTVPPVVVCDDSHYTNLDGDTIIIPTGTHDCAAHLIIPPVIAEDTACNEVAGVKAMIPGYGSFQMTFDGTAWVAASPVKLPLSEDVIPIYYEAFDDCHNYGYDTCYVRVKDLTKPIAVCDKGVNVSLTDKKVWVEASTFDEGSWDNCGVNLILARRSDWTDACIDLCDSVVIHAEHHYNYVYAPVLETDKSINEVEAHYAKTIEWLANDAYACGDLVASAWYYDLLKYATVECEGSMDENEFDEYYYNAHGSDYGDPADLKQIGGGWAEEVLFSCEDACGPVTVEILVMDYWCNYSKCWTEVWVEDKTPITVANDVTDAEITCKTYRDLQYTLDGVDASIEDIVNAAYAGDEEAIAALDDIFGGYTKAWIDPYGNYVDADGEVIETDITLIDSTCYCEDVTTTQYVYDDHFGWVEEEVEGRACYYEAVTEYLTQGIIAVNCAENVQCDQEIWFDFDECGQGYIYRKFKIWQGCPTTEPSSHIPDTISRIQRIWVGNECDLDEGMFTYPADTTLTICGIEYDPLGSGNVVGAAHPDSVGTPSYIFDDDCRLVGIGHYDKVYRVVGGDGACYKIVRTWCFADWCETDKPVSDNWLLEPVGKEKVFEYVQKIIVLDTVPPVCTITGPVGDGEVISAGGCEYDFSATLDISDPCGIISYTARLDDITKDPVTVETWSGDLSGLVGDEELAVAGLVAGDYQLTAIVRDDCQNESICVYTFSIETGKKPTPVCISSITVELTPWDTDNDAVIDTAAATVWAEEFNSSSYAPCGSSDDDLEFYIEFTDDADAETLDLEFDLDSLALGCEHVGMHMVRMWVLSPTGSADYCDVMLIVQDNMQGCGDISANGQGAITGSIATEMEESVEQVNVKATLSSGDELDFVTTRSGAYAFATTLGANVTIEPVKDIEHGNGISTADMIKIQKHILGKATLENEYRMMAADVNNDGRVSALDLLDIRRLILGKTERFPNSTSWTFVNNVDGKESYTINGMNANMDIDFIGVKKGDVNVSNDPSRNTGRVAKHLVLQAQDLQMTSGNQYKVDITAANFRGIEGYQFTLNFDPTAIQLADVEFAQSLDLNEENFSFRAIDEGLVTTSWHSAEAIELGSDEVLFSLVFTANSDAQLSDVMTVNNRVTNAEAYSQDNELLGVALEFGQGEVADQSFVLYQNRPNPFKESTVVGFRLPEAANATVTVYDVTGKVIKVVEGDFQKGYNEVKLLSTDLSATGVMYYQLDSENYTATRKMVILE